ncbi:tRNA (adenosine(37)-N6)-threonylcarbamoyltransferase complex ATPase subunit type 1 TsaE [Mycoplasma elephantis]|uniref:tRNA (adenosine(37)-N6)-threonylcarbamoyltransferase complex ATPase subunit type 1 TsaE n=1 Tax=Mycoplasma elephantis TaxID=114882 RepID=UPI0005607156|nr:tRNA (adenosine(37)-N6)-threonylcarbamoyltransferase complex ATPase subunit type 1 TsaE [Mycoplasma elephantis]
MTEFVVKLPLIKNQEFVNFLENSIKNTQFIFLMGELGAGKTTLVKLIGKILNEQKNIKSPSFNYINIYDKFIHIDAYNLNGSIDDFEDFIEDKLVIVEWANLLNYDKYKNRLIIKIKYTKNLNERKYLVY